MKTLIIIIIGVLLLSIIGLGYFINKEPVEDNSENKYQGPVPEGFDEEHFRKTGETKPIENGK